MNTNSQIRRAATCHDRADCGLAQGLCRARAAIPTSGFRSARLRSATRTSRRSGSMIRPDPIPKARAPIDLAAGLKPVRESWIAARGYAPTEGRAIKPEDNGVVSADHLAPLCPASRTLRAGRPGELVTQLEFARAGIVTEEMIYVAHRENLARETAARRRERTPRRWRELRRGHPRIRDAGIRARGSGARARDHSRQHQSRRTRADGDRPQFSRQGQRQHRQLGGELRRRRGSREDGVGDPLGRRHGHGPLHRAQHPQHPLLDRAQRSGADRHGADLPGAGEGRRRSARNSTGKCSRTR